MQASQDTAARSLSFLGLRGIRLFEGLDAFSLEEIARRCSWRRYKRNDRVISRQGTDRDVYLVISGVVRVAAHSPRGRGIIFRDIVSGEVFGELAALDQRERSADVLAVSDSLLASMSPESFHEVLAQYPGVRQKLFRSLSASVRDLTDRLVELSTLDVERRIAMELLRLARQAGVDSNASRIQPMPRHKELASRVGTSREQVTRTLSSLTRRKLISREGRALAVRDMDALERMLAEGSSA
jgi:CRP-like cAMP-binding protein